MVTRILDKMKDLSKNDASSLHDCIARALKHTVCMRENFGGVKFLANLAINTNSPNFFPANTYKDTETTEDLPLDPPKFSLPFASTVAIRQNFTPPKFSHVR